MSTILIKTDKQSKLLAELAKKLGGNVIALNNEQSEYFYARSFNGYDQDWHSPSVS